MEITEMTKLVCMYKDARNDYEDAKQISRAKKEHMDMLQAQILGSLEENSLSNFRVPNVGNVTVVHKLSYRVPTGENKKVLMDYIQDKYGDAGIMTYFSVPSATLNKFAREELEAGSIVEGLEPPTAHTVLSFRKQ